jgi:hypothetical protein
VNGSLAVHPLQHQPTNLGHDVDVTGIFDDDPDNKWGAGDGVMHTAVTESANKQTPGDGDSDVQNGTLDHPPSRFPVHP